MKILAQTIDIFGGNTSNELNEVVGVDHATNRGVNSGRERNRHVLITNQSFIIIEVGAKLGRETVAR